MPLKYQTVNNTIPAGGCFELPLYVDDNQTVKFTFHTQGGDINFALRRQDPETREREDVLRMERVPCHIDPVVQSITIEKGGLLVFQWDNTFSWLREKSLSYTITAEPPKSQTIAVSNTITNSPKAQKAVLEQARGRLRDAKQRRKAAVADRDTSHSQLKDVEQQLQELQQRKEALQKQVEGTETAAAEAETEFEEAARSYRGLLYRIGGPKIIAKIFQFCSSDDLVRWMAVSKRFVDRPELSHFWEEEANRRFALPQSGAIGAGAEGTRDTDGNETESKTGKEEAKRTVNAKGWEYFSLRYLQEITGDARIALTSQEAYDSDYEDLDPAMFSAPAADSTPADEEGIIHAGEEEGEEEETKAPAEGGKSRMFLV